MATMPLWRMKPRKLLFRKVEIFKSPVDETGLLLDVI